jgi:cysteine synthase A
MQGWTPDFIPKLTEDAVTMKLIDRILPVNGADAMRCSRELAQQEGIFVGITSGATFSGALKVCAEAPPGAKCCACCPIRRSAISVPRSSPTYPPR